MKIDEDRLLDEIAKQNFAIFLILTVLSLFWTSLSVTSGVMIGGLISIGGFAWLRRSLGKMLKKPNRRAARKFQWSYVFRLTAIGLALFLAIALLKVNPLALCFGLSIVVFSVMVGILRFI